MTVRLNAEEGKGRDKKVMAWVNREALDKVLSQDNPRLFITLTVENN